MLVRGKFGDILVTDGNRSRRLYINRELQGGALFTPGAETVDPSLSGPGPVSEAKYALGWLLAGHLNPQASVLMVGLGSGAGVVQLLANFPDVDVTVVEIDPAIKQVATECFPLLEYYSDQGRLNIVIADATDFLADKGVWDVGMADAYTGQSYDLEKGYFPTFCQHCASVYVNSIGSLMGASMLDVVDLMDEYGHVAHSFFQPNQLSDGGIDPRATSNWIITSDVFDEPLVAQLKQWEPFPQYEKGVEMTRRQWKQMLGTCILIS